MAADTKTKAKTTVTRSVKVEFDWADSLDLFRRECGAPANAAVSFDGYDSVTVEWSTTEGPK